MTAKIDPQSLTAPLRQHLRNALEALGDAEANPGDEAALGRLGKATFMASLGAKALAASAIPDEDFIFARGSHVILNTEN